MKVQEYIESISSKITDTELQSRIREELEDHWEDYCENQSMPDAPEDVFGNETLLTYQTNAVASPGMFGKDIVLSVVCGVFTLVLFVMLSSFLTLDLANASLTDKFFTVIAGIVGVTFWSGVAWYIYLALHRHLMIRYGQSIRRTFLLAVAFALPFVFLGIESVLLSSINVLIADSPFSATWQLASSVLVLVMLFGLFFLAGRLVSRRITDVDRILSRLRRGVPLLISAAVIAGATILVTASDAPGGHREVLALVGTPFTLPLLISYLFWGFGTNIMGFLFHAVGIPLIFAFWTTTVFALCLGVILPLARLALRKPVPLALQFAASILAPLAVILPMVPQDVPQVTWNIPLVWTWEMLERKQLNITYPWAASLMRRNDGINVDYAAYLVDKKITVMQGGGVSYVITPKGITTIETSPDLEAATKGDGGAYAEIPIGFTCDGKLLEEFSDTHNGSTGLLGMFGIQCGTLAYKGIEIATISYGSLIDLDVSDDGLLAVSINMGSYDPTYVYVVSIPGVIAQ